MVLACGIAALAFSDFVRPLYWLPAAAMVLLRWWRGPRLAIGEMQASLIGWVGFFWGGIELLIGVPWIVVFTDFLLILSLAVAIEAATARNHLHRILVGIFLLLAASVLTDSVLFVLPLAGMVWFLWRATLCLYGRNLPGGDLPLPPAGSDLGGWLAMLLAGALLFFLAPRFSTHRLLQPTQPRMATSGFSDRVALGDFARSLDTTVVLRIEPVERSDRAIARFHRLITGRYWRGTLLHRFTGHGWRQGPQPRAGRWPAGTTLRMRGGNARATAALLYREATDHPYLLLPDGTTSIARIPRMLRASADGVLRFATAPNRRLRLAITLTSDTGPPIPAGPPTSADRDRSRTPAALRRWLAAIAPRSRSAYARLQAVQRELRGWRYDIHARIDDLRPLASFLAGKRGHCELFATTLALAARELGFPAHLVNGYYGGEWNEIGGFLLIRQQHAHSWVEVWHDGRWWRMDPTPPARWRLSGVWLPRLDAAWESLRMAWYRYVLEFRDSDRAAALRALARAAGHPAALLALVILVTAAPLLWWRRRAGGANPAAIPLLDGWLRRRGIARTVGQPLSALPTPPGVAAESWNRFVAEWEEGIYRQGRRWPWWRLALRLRRL